MDVKFLAIGCSLVIFIFALEKIRQEKLTFEYALTWLIVSFLVLALSINDTLLIRAARVFGFSLPSNFIFFLVSVFVVFLSLLLTLYANEQNKRSEVLAQNLAILEYRLRQLENRGAAST